MMSYFAVRFYSHIRRAVYSLSLTIFVVQCFTKVISMTARLLDGGDPGVCGILTSGGTESIILATKAHRDYFREARHDHHTV